MHQSEEEVRQLQRKIQAVENELDQVQENLTNAITKLEEKDKALQNVSSVLFNFMKSNKIRKSLVSNLSLFFQFLSILIIDMKNRSLKSSESNQSN